MQGHIYRRRNPDGSYTRWRAMIDLPPDATGKRRQKTTSHDTKRQAQTWLAKTLAELQAGEVYDTKVTVAQYLTDWLTAKQALRPSTRLEYARHVEQIFIPELAHLKLADLRRTTSPRSSSESSTATTFGNGPSMPAPDGTSSPPSTAP